MNYSFKLDIVGYRPLQDAGVLGTWTNSFMFVLPICMKEPVRGKQKRWSRFFGCGRSISHSTSTVALASAVDDSIIGFTWVSSEKSE